MLRRIETERPWAQTIGTMKHSFYTFWTLLVLFIAGCSTSPDKFKTEEGIAIRKKVDEAVVRLDTATRDLERILRIDHSRLAEGAGVYTPPSVVTLFSNPEVNAMLISRNQLVAVDLPYRLLCYSEPELKNASLAYTSPEFIQRRHGLTQNDLAVFSREINTILATFPDEMISVTDLSGVNKDFGLIVKRSAFDFYTTIKNLKEGIKGQGDTEIFGEIDFQREAKPFGIELDPTTLILFGAPKPGGQAMHECPKIGLDAFCQKLLIFEKEKEVFIAYNDIVDFSKLYYQKWTLPQRVVNYRLNKVYGEAIGE